MPIYEFECSHCREISEHLMKISDKNPQVCPHCQKEGALSKLMSRTSFVLKGNGWYETDFKGSQKKESSKTPSSTVSKPSSEKKTSSKDSSKSSSSTKAS